jgi:GNAT superfamily N-acetyltransferase
MYLAGSPQSPGLSDGLHRLLSETILPEAKRAGLDPQILYVDAEAWESQLDAILPGRFPLKLERSYFECTELRESPQAYLPAGFTLQLLEASLLSRGQLGNLDYLREELVSERSSEAEFLEKSFGVVALHGDELAAWCLSEYNLGRRCEVGVATVEQYQRRGLGTAVTLALVEQALANGYQRVGWHCWKSNTPSAALALRAGFAHVQDYPAYLLSLN